MTNAMAHPNESAFGWDRTLYAFLAEKHRRSGSQRTVQAYSRMLGEFFGRAAKTPDQGTSATSSPGPTGMACRARSHRPSPSAPGSPASAATAAS